MAIRFYEGLNSAVVSVKIVTVGALLRLGPRGFIRHSQYRIHADARHRLVD